jgi:hypothetical protein
VWGCFGFLASNYFVMMILIQGFLSGLFGGMGQHFCVLFNAPIVTQSVLLIVPFIATGIACALMIDEPPNLLTIAGAIMAIFGAYKIN